MKPCIGIPCALRPDKARPWFPPNFSQRQTYVDSIVQAGGAPMLIPASGQEDFLQVVAERIDGLLLAGGVDIDPARYGEAPHERLEEVDPLRDELEIELTHRFLASGKPVLGICRGIQLLNVALGGTLYQDIDAQVEGAAPHRESYARQDWNYLAHEITITPESRLARLLGVTDLAVNSLHHQAVKDLAPGLRPIAWAADGIVEGVEGDAEQFVLAVQCHPETLQAQADPRWQRVFRAFVESSAAFMPRSTVE